VIEEKIEIRTADGTPEGFLYRPEAGSRYPGVIHFTDIGGIRPAHEGMARRLTAEGYAVLMPNVFYRTGRPPLFDASAKSGDERMKRFAELATPLTSQAIARDVAAYVDFLAAHDSVSQGAMGVVGYCFTGKMALYTAFSRPDKIAAAASFHGAGLATDAPNSPHLALGPLITARLYFGHATSDKSMPAEAIDKLNRALEAWGGKYESEVYEGAYHSWTVPDSPVYNQLQADRAFEKLIGLFAETLLA
jgi:carboxymethylenebutenolidase